jgi:mono/diheme cytochrome c family protein
MRAIFLTAIMSCAAVASAAAPDAKTVRTWQAKCAPCHGDDGKAETKKGKEEAVRSMATAEWQKAFTDDELRKAIRDGIDRTTKDGVKQKMDAFATKLDAAQTDALVAYMRTLGPAPAAGAAPAAAPPATAAPAAPAAPAAATKETLAKGKKLYTSRCAGCHGADGKGQTAKGKKAGIADMTTADWQKAHTDEALAAALARGKVKSHDKDVGHMAIKDPKDVAALTAWMRTFAPR